MESEILTVQLIQPWYQYIIQFFVTFIPSILVGLGVYFLLRKSRRKEAFEFEKKKRAFEERLIIIRGFKEHINNLFEAIEMGFRKLSFDELNDVNVAEIIVKKNRELTKYYEANINIFSSELTQAYSSLKQIIVKGFIVKLKESKRTGKKLSQET